MSVTVTIHNNRAYCHEHNLVVYDYEDCICLESSCPSLRFPDPYCAQCNGTGRHKSEKFPFDINMANDNFAAIWSSLGLPICDFVGSIDGRQLLAALANTTKELPVRPAVNQGNFYDAGLSVDRIKQRLKELREIAKEAERREELVLWY